jgi:hypothetical protein
VNPYSDLPGREQERLARVGTTTWLNVRRSWWRYDCACGELGTIVDGTDSHTAGRHCCSFCGTVHKAPDDQRRELIRFVGEVGRPGDPHRRTVRVDVELGTNAHVEALATGWLTQFRGHHKRADWPVYRDWRESGAVARGDHAWTDP